MLPAWAATYPQGDVISAGVAFTATANVCIPDGSGALGTATVGLSDCSCINGRRRGIGFGLCWLIVGGFETVFNGQIQGLGVNKLGSTTLGNRTVVLQNVITAGNYFSRHRV